MRTCCGRAAKSQPNCAKRMESAWSSFPLSKHPTPYDSASKLDALHTLRVAVHPQEPSQLASILDYGNAMYAEANKLGMIVRHESMG